VSDQALVEQAIGEPALQVTRLAGLTNRNFRVRTAGGDYVVRLPGRGTDRYIDRGAERHNTAVAAGLGLTPDVRWLDGAGTMVAPFVEGEVLTPERLRADRDVLADAARTLAGLHRSGVHFEGRFDPAAQLRRHYLALDGVPEGTDDLVEGALGVVASLDGPEVPSHNDSWPRNFILTGGGLVLIDWEYSGRNDPAWDLADLSVEADLDVEAEGAMLDAYGADASLRERVTAMKPVTDVVWGLWALIQDADHNPALDFPAYAQTRLTRAARALRSGA